MGKDVDVEALVGELDRAWGEMLALMARGSSVDFGPANLLRCEMQLLEGCIEDAKRNNDLHQLKHCLSETTRLMKHFRTLSLDRWESEGPAACKAP